MAEATPKIFKVADGKAPLDIDDIELHRTFETDRDGRTSIHVWITAKATPTDDTFQSLTADLVFVLLDGSDELGTCTSRAVSFEKKEAAALHADDGLRIDVQANVTGIAVKMDVVRVTHETGELNFGSA